MEYNSIIIGVKMKKFLTKISELIICIFWFYIIYKLSFLCFYLLSTFEYEYENKMQSATFLIGTLLFVSLCSAVSYLTYKIGRAHV